MFYFTRNHPPPLKMYGDVRRICTRTGTPRRSAWHQSQSLITADATSSWLSSFLAAALSSLSVCQRQPTRSGWQCAKLTASVLVACFCMLNRHTDWLQPSISRFLKWSATSSLHFQRRRSTARPCSRASSKYIAVTWQSPVARRQCWWVCPTLYVAALRSLTSQVDSIYSLSIDIRGTDQVHSADSDWPSLLGSDGLELVADYLRHLTYSNGGFRGSLNT